MQGPANLHKYIDAIENPVLLRSRVEVADCFEHSYAESHIPVKDGIAYCRTQTAAEYLCRFRAFRMMKPEEYPKASVPSLTEKAAGAVKTAGKAVVDTVRNVVGKGKKKAKKKE